MVESVGERERSVLIEGVALATVTVVEGEPPHRLISCAAGGAEAPAAPSLGEGGFEGAGLSDIVGSTLV